VLSQGRRIPSTSCLPPPSGTSQPGRHSGVFAPFLPGGRSAGFHQRPFFCFLFIFLRAAVLHRLPDIIAIWGFFFVLNFRRARCKRFGRSPFPLHGQDGTIVPLLFFLIRFLSRPSTWSAFFPRRPRLFPRPSRSKSSLSLF